MSRLVEESPRHRPFVDSLSATRHRFARWSGCGLTLEMLARERISTGRQNHRLPARATTRCWITPVGVASAGLLLGAVRSSLVESAGLATEQVSGVLSTALAVASPSSIRALGRSQPATRPSSRLKPPVEAEARRELPPRG
jgi:hypothetical protein